LSIKRQETTRENTKIHPERVVFTIMLPFQGYTNNRRRKKIHKYTNKRINDKNATIKNS